MFRTRAAAVELAVLLAAFIVADVASAAGSKVVAFLASSVVGACATLLAMHDERRKP